MERRTSLGGPMVAAIFVVFVLANGVDADKLYACWGSCYTSCFKGKAQTDQAGMFSCDYKCLKACIPPPSNDLQLYCGIGCSLKRCIPFSLDSAKKESCLGWCTNLCNKILPHE